MWGLIILARPLTCEHNFQPPLASPPGTTRGTSRPSQKPMAQGCPTGKLPDQPRCGGVVCLTLCFEPGGSQLALQAGTFRVGRDWHPLKFCPNRQHGSTGSTHLSLWIQQNSQRQQKTCQSILVSRLYSQPRCLGSTSSTAVDLLLNSGQLASIFLPTLF